MAQTKENPAARMGVRTGPLDASSSAADGSGTAPNSAPNQAEILRDRGRQACLEALHRDIAAESACWNAAVSARCAATKLNHFADNMQLGPYREADAAFEAARQFAKESLDYRKKMHSALDAEAAAVLAEHLYPDLAASAEEMAQ